MNNFKFNNFTNVNTWKYKQVSKKPNLIDKNQVQQNQHDIQKYREKTALQMANSMVAGLLTVDMFYSFFKQPNNKSSRFVVLAAGLGCGLWFVSSLIKQRELSKNNPFKLKKEV